MGWPMATSKSENIKDLRDMCTLLETNNSPLKMDGWNTFSFPFGALPIFRCEMAVSFREGKF